MTVMVIKEERLLTTVRQLMEPTIQSIPTQVIIERYLFHLQQDRLLE